MHKGSCHCGAIQFELTESPEKLVDCNCSICRRIGALWAHVDIGSVTIDASSSASTPYIHGDKTLAMHTCNVCGCTTHWVNLQEDGEHMAVNFRMCDPSELEHFPIRKFDGADTWRFID